MDAKVQLRPVNESDLSGLLRLLWDPDTTGEFQWFGYQLDRAKELERRWASDGLIGGDASFLTVGCDDECFGWVDWRSVGRFGVYQVGIALMPEHRGRGIGTAAQWQLVEHLFSTTPAHRLQAGTEVDNVAEQKALERVGFRHEGIQRGGCTSAPAAGATASCTGSSATTVSRTPDGPDCVDVALRVDRSGALAAEKSQLFLVGAVRRRTQRPISRRRAVGQRAATGARTHPRGDEVSSTPGHGAGPGRPMRTASVAQPSRCATSSSQSRSHHSIESADAAWRRRQPSADDAGRPPDLAECPSTRPCSTAHGTGPGLVVSPFTGALRCATWCYTLSRADDQAALSGHGD